MDNTELRNLVNKLFDEEDWSRVRQLQHLRAKGTAHGWLWNICPRNGTIMKEDTYIVAVQKRLGREFFDEPRPCKLCGALMDTMFSYRVLRLGRKRDWTL